MSVMEVIRQELVNNGKNPEDFNIEVKENFIKVTPKWSYQIRQLVKEEDRPIIEDVNAVGETLAFVLMDNNDIAETLAFALLKISELETEIAALKGE